MALHLDQFAVDEFFLPVRLQQQLVAGGHFQFPFLPHIKQAKPAPNGKMLSEPSAR